MNMPGQKGPHIVLVVLAVIGAVAISGVVGMWLMHGMIMGGGMMSCCGGTDGRLFGLVIIAVIVVAAALLIRRGVH